MRRFSLALALSLVACGGGSAAPTRPPASTPNLALTATAIVRRGGPAGAPLGSPTATTRPLLPPSPTSASGSPSPVPVTFVSVTGAPPGRDASVTIQGPPNTVCSIEFFAPGGETTEAPGLDDKRTDASGRTSWSWPIATGIPPGMGRVIVFCGSAVGTGPITIG